MTVWTPLWVAIGGAIGTLLRFALVRYTTLAIPVNFPVGTAIVNILGSFVIGFWSAWVLKQHVFDTPNLAVTQWDLAIRVGILGGFTTFSAFSMETLHLMQNQRLGMAFLNAFLNLGIGLTAAWFGLKLGNWVVAE